MSRETERRIFYAVLFVTVCVLTAGMFAGCSDSTSSPGVCIQRNALGQCVDRADPAPIPVPVPTPAPAACSSGGCPILVSIIRFAENPSVASVTAFPPGPFDLWLNGTPRHTPNGIAFVKVGDVVSLCRCCGCSIQYLVF